MGRTPLLSLKSGLHGKLNVLWSDMENPDDGKGEANASQIQSFSLRLRAWGDTSHVMCLMASLIFSLLPKLFSVIILGVISNKLRISFGDTTFCAYTANNGRSDEPGACNTGYGIGSIGLVVGLIVTGEIA